MTTPIDPDDEQESAPTIERKGVTAGPESGGPEESAPTDASAIANTDVQVDLGILGLSTESDIDVTVNLTGGDLDSTVNLRGDEPIVIERDDAAAANLVTRSHLKGLLEALIFASDKPIKVGDLAKQATAPVKQVKELLEELKSDYASRGMQLDEVAGGWVFRTNAAFAPFVRDLTKQRPVKLTRAQVETLAIMAYRQPITRPEIDEIRGVDCGPVLKLLLERDLVRILGKKDEPGRPLLYGTTTQFLEFFGLKSLRDLPTLREFTDLNEESRRTVEKELGETLETAAMERGGMDSQPPDTLPPEHGAAMTDIPPAITEMDDPRGDTARTGDIALEPQEKTGETPVADMDPEEEFPDDDDEDFDDDDDDEDDEDGDGEEEKGGADE